jgi:hypothetical protein
MAGVAAALPLRLPGAATAGDIRFSGPDPYDALNLFKFSTFSGQVGTTFQIQIGKSKVNTTLLEARRRIPSDDRCFSLQFKSLSGNALKQGTYLFDHSWLGRFAMFIVPAGGDSKGSFFRAVFNRIDR